ncbi:phage tail domain-containing protein [Domibacillus mangrovi]|uniref:Phage tail protein n=1 Tax=Domibacillus mangrovi TaxID=1714354 RepID=A0A1Q5P450_9BACI|nr:phage tail domain-containing protein [Domibacillus mangrovi]OKL36988.1 hypothetical protein BLL40_05195 [Domibacillus mangrovi]
MWNSPYNLIIERQNGERYDLYDKGIVTKLFQIESPSPRHVREELDGMDGFLEGETLYEGRSMRGEFFMVAKDTFDRARNEIFRLFSSREAFFITKMSEPYKRWSVKTDSPYVINQRAVMGDFSIEFTSASPFAQSPGTTLNWPEMEHYYGIGEGKIDAFDPPIQYEFNTSSFFVFNDSDETVDPRSMELRIKLQGTLNNPIIKNVTTNDEWQWSGSASAEEVILLDGIQSLKNGQSIFNNTNKKLISLAPGWNEFSITGAADFLISFDFRFYYL